MREKLIELLKCTPDVWMAFKASEKIADHLIANGVTIQRWIPVTELPPRKGCYLVTVRHWCDGKPVTREAYYTCSGWISCERGQDITERVMYWMPLPLPEPPKGE